ncbi:MAG: ribonuclease III [Planctomycetota bacterium]|nr:ribonuclease III [Planctomycetota bacterium]
MNSSENVHPDASDIQLVDDSGSADGSDQASKLARCQQIIDYKFEDAGLLLSALTHASGASHRLESNERLEFLGDAVLGLTVCQWLFEDYPEYNEGDLTKIKSAVVSRRSCGKVACRLGLDRCLIVGRGVTRNRSFPRSLVSDVFESVVAAIYLDAGVEVVKERLKKWLAEEVQHAVESQGAGNFKSTLQQYAQRELASTPVYRLVRESGPDHRKSFLISAIIDDRPFTAAWGNNKKDAEQRAASNALAELHNQPLPYPQESESQDGDSQQ